MTGFPTLYTKRLRLRELTKSDAPALLAIHGDAEAMKWFGTDPMTHIEQAEQLVEVFNSWRAAANPGIRWGMEELARGQLIGTCGFFKWNRSWRSCSIGFELAQAAQRNGFMREALVSCIDWGITHMELNRIEALVHPENTRSLHLLERTGFVREGVLRKAGYWGQAYHDLVQYSLLREDAIYLS